MYVILRLEGHIREFYPHLQEPTTIFLSRPATVAEILGQAGIPAELPGAVLCGKLRVGLDHVPEDGQELVLLSPLAGG